MIEFLWVSAAQEAQSEDPRRTLLWERWSGREGESSPFGVTASKLPPHSGIDVQGFTWASIEIEAGNYGKT
jgi:hypothetical protein